MLPPLTHWFARAVCATQTNKTTKWAVGCSMVAWGIFINRIQNYVYMRAQNFCRFVVSLATTRISNA